VTRVCKSGKAIEVYYQHSTFEKRKTPWRNGDLYFSGKYTCISIIMHLLLTLTDQCFTINFLVVRFLTLPPFEFAFVPSPRFECAFEPSPSFECVSAPLSPHLLGSAFYNPISFWVRLWALTIQFLGRSPITIQPILHVFIWVGHPLQWDHSFTWVGHPITTRPLFLFPSG